MAAPSEEVIASRPHQSTLFRLAILMAFSIVALLAVVGISSQGLERVSREEDDEIRVSIVLISNAYQLKVAVERQLVGLRGYLAAEQPDLLRPWQEGAQEFARAASELEPVLRTPQDRQLLEELRRLEARHRTLGTELIALKRQGRDAEAGALFLSQSHPMKSRLVQTADALIASQRAEVAHMHQEVNRVESAMRAQLTLGALVAVPFMLALAASIAWRVWVPLRDLAAASQAIAAGRLDVRVPRHRNDEFGDVSAAFNAMAVAVERSLRNLQETNEELRRVDRYRDDFLSMVTHELRTPLTSIKGFARLLERGSAGPLSPAQREHVGRIVANASRLLALVNDLLDSTAIRQGQLELSLTPTPYAPLVQEVVAHLQPLAQQKRLALTLEALPEVSPPVDAARLTQVLTNLVSNAIHFTPEAGAVTVRAQLREGALFTEVQDTGPGIAPEAASRLFRPFSRVSKQPGGTGLGLSISRAIVEGHGGTIGVTSEPGQGARFWFTLPLT